MAFLTISNITINGSKQAFNGYPYAVEYDIPFTPDPSKLTMHFISEDGTYSTDSILSAITPYQIQVGTTIVDNFYAISYTEKNSSEEGNTLEVTFWDGSIALDRFWIGRHKVHGTNASAITPVNQVNLSQLPIPLVVSVYNAGEVWEEEADAQNFKNGDGQIILGSELHPCDINEDGVFDNKDIPLLLYPDLDPCMLRCAGEPVNYNPLLNACLTTASTKVFETAYMFSDLITAIKAAGINVGTVPTLSFPQYKSQHTGPLRTVLKDWCTDFGLTFYWENDTLKFADVSKPIQIAVPNFSCIESKTHTKTLEGTVRRGSISYYGADGNVVEKSCKEGRQVALQCLTLRDLYTDTWLPQYGDGDTGTPVTSATAGVDNGATASAYVPSPADQEYVDTIYPNGVDVEKLEASVVCSHYDKRLRFLYLTQSYYGLKSVSDYVSNKGATLDRLGSMNIAVVLDSNATDTTNPAALTQYNDLLTNPQVLKPDERTLFLNNNGFFVIAKIDLKKLDDQYQFERKLSDEFIGKFWVRSYYAPFYGEDPEITPSCKYIGANMPDLKDNVGFVNYKHSNNSNVWEICQKLKIQYNPAPNNGTNPALAKLRDINQNRKCLICYDSPTSTWIPDANVNNYFTSILDEAANSTPKLCTGVTTETLQGLVQPQIQAGTISGDDVAQGRVQVLAVFPGTFTISTAKGVNTQDKDPIVQPVAQFISVQTGLSSKNTYVYTINGTQVTMPAASSCLMLEDNQGAIMESNNAGLTANYDLSKPLQVSAPHYTVIVAPSRTTHVEIPKVEAVMVTSPPAATGAGTLLLDYDTSLQIDQGLIKLLNNLQGECIPSFATLQEIQTEFNAATTYSILQPYEDYTFSVAGIDLPSGNITIGQGLESLSITVNDKGVFSTYGIGNRKFTPPSKDVLIRRLEYELKRALAQKADSNIFSNAKPPIPQTGFPQ